MLFSKTMRVLNPLNSDFNSSSILKFSSYLKENTPRLNLKYPPINALRERTAVYCDNNTYIHY